MQRETISRPFCAVSLKSAQRIVGEGGANTGCFSRTLCKREKQLSAPSPSPQRR